MTETHRVNTDEEFESEHGHRNRVESEVGRPAVFIAFRQQERGEDHDY